MTDYDVLHSGLSKAAWGYFFLNFDINFGQVSIFPKFVGFLLLLAAVRQLAAEQTELLLLKPLCVILAAYHMADWLFSWFGTDLVGRYMFLDLIVTAAGLYFHFQFLTDMAALAEKVQNPGMMIDGDIRVRRNVYVVLTTLLSLLANILPASELEAMEAGSMLLLPLAVVAAIVSLTVMATLFSLRKWLENAPREYWD